MENLDQVVATIKADVCQHYEAYKKPILLSDLGSRHVDLLRELKKDSVSLLDIICKHLGSDLTMSIDEHHPARRFVGPSEYKQEIEVYARNNPPASKNPPQGSVGDRDIDSIKAEQVKKSVLFAFTRSLNDGYSRYLEMKYPFRFNDVVKGVSPEENSVHIDSAYILGADDSPDAQDKVFEKFKEWVRVEKVNWQSLLFSYYPVKSADKSHKENDLARLIEAQPEDLRRRMLIPADIALRLMSE